MTAPDETQGDCPLCGRIEAGRLLAQRGVAVAVADAFPVSPGHSLVLSKRHVADLFDLPHAEQLALWSLVAEVREALRRAHEPDGFNVGVNAGAAAGQTVPHAHVHVIPRYVGDVRDPRGGIRWVIPDRAAYWR
jgi:diadenosine tetraphosphate (Ap4A) HIT family hydrolase